MGEQVPNKQIQEEKIFEKHGVPNEGELRVKLCSTLCELSDAMLMLESQINGDLNWGIQLEQLDELFDKIKGMKAIEDIDLMK